MLLLILLIPLTINYYYSEEQVKEPEVQYEEYKIRVKQLKKDCDAAPEKRLRWILKNM